MHVLGLTASLPHRPLANASIDQLLAAGQDFAAFLRARRKTHPQLELKASLRSLLGHVSRYKGADGWIVWLPLGAGSARLKTPEMEPRFGYIWMFSECLGVFGVSSPLNTLLLG